LKQAFYCDIVNLQMGDGVASPKGEYMTLMETIAFLMLIVAVINLVVYIFRKKSNTTP